MQPFRKPSFSPISSRGAKKHSTWSVPFLLMLMVRSMFRHEHSPKLIKARSAPFAHCSPRLFVKGLQANVRQMFRRGGINGLRFAFLPHHRKHICTKNAVFMLAFFSFFTPTKHPEKALFEGFLRLKTSD